MQSQVSLLFKEHVAVLHHLEHTDPSFHATLQVTLPKALLLAAASEFETRACAHLIGYVKSKTSDPKIAVLVDRQVVERKYHTWFDWRRRNANGFWAFFGDEFKTKMKKKLQEDESLTEGLKAFLEIGDLRNQLVHNDYAKFTLEKTLEEIHELYLNGGRFVESLPKILDETY